MKNQLARVEEYIRKAKQETSEQHNIIIERNTNCPYPTQYSLSPLALEHQEPIQQSKIITVQRPAEMEKSYCRRDMKEVRKYEEAVVRPEVTHFDQQDEYNYYIKLNDSHCQPHVQVPPPAVIPKAYNPQTIPAYSLAIVPEIKKEVI